MGPDITSVIVARVSCKLPPLNAEQRANRTLGMVPAGLISETNLSAGKLNCEHARP